MPSRCGWLSRVGPLHSLACKVTASHRSGERCTFVLLWRRKRNNIIGHALLPHPCTHTIRPSTFCTYQVLTSEPTDSDLSAADAINSVATQGQLPVSPDGIPQRFRGTGAIPIVATELPGHVVISMRIAGVNMATFVNSTAALARAGHGDGGLPERDEVVTLTEASALHIEACVEMDVARGKVRGGTLLRGLGRTLSEVMMAERVVSKPTSAPS